MEDFSERLEGTVRRAARASPAVYGTARPDLDIVTGATAHDARHLRMRCEYWLQQIGAPPGLVNDLVLAIYEALANAVEHAYEPGHRRAVIRLCARAAGSDILIWVCDEGRWRATGQGEHRGRGLTLMHRLVGDTRVESGPRGTTVRLHARLTSPAHC